MAKTDRFSNPQLTTKPAFSDSARSHPFSAAPLSGGYPNNHNGSGGWVSERTTPSPTKFSGILPKPTRKPSSW